MIDLQRFCSKDPYRPTIAKPWSRGEYTYATNGHIIIRVPRHSEVAENAAAPDAEKILGSYSGAMTTRMANIALPPVTTAECETCNGSGFEHDCPHCECECKICAGTGESNSDKGVSVALRGATFAAEHVRMLQSLPEIEIAVRVQEPNPMFFRFKGGDGALMPFRGERPIHLSEAA